MTSRLKPANPLLAKWVSPQTTSLPLKSIVVGAIFVVKSYSKTAISKNEKPIIWIGSSLEDLKSFPKDVMRLMGQALNDAQQGGKHPRAKPLKGFSGAGVLEVVDDFDGDTYRTVYTVKLAGAIYVLHAFQKKSKKGNETPAREIELVRQRLKTAEACHKENRA